MLQLENSTPFAADITVFPNAQGIDTLYVIAKATFDVGDKLTLAETQCPPTLKDEYYGEPQCSSLKYPSEYHLAKPGTDVIIIGDCIAPNHTAVASCDVEVGVGSLNEVVRVFGNRIWLRSGISSPELFERMPMTYENAFGGTLRAPDGTVKAAEERNPVGLGFAGECSAEQMQGERLPNLEDPSQLIRHVGDRPSPACFAAIAPFWSARSQFAGTFDEKWQTERAPYLPLDFDSRFFHAASPDLTSHRHLQGGEPIWISNMTAEGRWAFHLPTVTLVGHVFWRRRQDAINLVLETVTLEPNQARLMMTWRGELPVNQHALQVENVKLKMQRQVVPNA